MIATIEDAAVDQTRSDGIARPHYPYPQFARYQGDINAAANFEGQKR